MSVELAKKAPAKPAFRKMNEHLVCSLCKGYLVDATTIVECLHSFCRSCIVQYLQASSFCPTCEVQLHKGSPLRSLKPDKTLQDIVYKLVPNLFHNEMRRRRVYYDTHPQYADQTTPEQRGDCLERFYSPDDSVSLSLEYHDRRKSSAAPAPSSPPADEPKSSSPPSSTSSSSPPADGQKSLPPKRYLKCPALFTIGLLKKFIRLKFDLPQELVIDIFQRRESLADEYTLLDIAYIYPWKTSEPMKFFYRVRDPRVPESDEEVEREMPSLSAAVGGRATRASRRASSASSLASPLGSPRGSPVPSGKRSRPDMEEKECDKQDPTPPPARLTAQPPTGAAVHPKPVAVKPVPSPTSPGPTGPKITLTISPSRGTVTSTTTEPATPKSPPPAAPALKPATAAPTPTPTPAPAPVKKNGAATPAAVKNGPATPKTPSFAATVTTKTANGGFVTVKNPIARPLNGVTVGSKTPASPQHVPASPKMTPILPKPAQGVPKAKRLTNGLPLLAPKGDVRAYSQSPQASAKPPTPTAPAPPSNMALPAAEAASRRTTTPVTASNARPSAPSAPAPKPAASPAPAASQATEAPSAAQKQEEEKKTMETAKAILQLSMGFKQSRSDTPTDSTLHNHIDKIVKDLDDDESNDGTLVIKSEPSSPASSGARSPVPSPNPQPPTATPAALPPSLPKVNGLTITPIEPSKRKATSSPALEEKRPRMEQATAGKRPAEGPPPSPAAPKQAKVDKIADLIKRKQEQERLHSQQERDKKAATQQPQAGGQTNALRPVGNPSQAAKPALNSTKPSSPLTKQPLSSPTTLKSFPPAQMKPIAPKPPGIPANAQGKPVSQAAAAMPGQPSASMAAKAAPAAPPSTQHQTKPAAAAAAARPTSAPQSHQDKLSQQTAGKPTSAPKPSSAPQAQGQQQQQAKSTAAPPARSPSGAQGLQQLQQAQQAKTAASQHGAARQVQQSKPAPAQPGPQAKAAAAPQQGQPSKPAPAQPAKQVSFGAAREQDNGAKMAMEARKRATPSPQQSPQQSAVKSPESKSKKPIPDLQRLQRPPPSLTGTTVNGCVSLAEVKEQLAKKGQYSPPPGQQPPNKTPPRLLEMSQRRSAPPAPSGASGTAGAPGGFGALDLSSASPRASDHGGSWTPPPSLGLAQALAKRQQLMMAPQGLPLRPPPSSLSSLSSSSPSPPADSPGSVSLSPDLFLDPAVLAQHQAALLHQLQLQSLFQTQAAGLSAGLSAGLKKTMEEWDRSRGGVRATAKRK